MKILGEIYRGPWVVCT